MAEIYWPFNPSTITEGFGWSEWRGGIHYGIDFGIAQGTGLKATGAGRIRNIDGGIKDGAGIEITTPDGWILQHWHVSEFGLSNGAQVKAGDIIGKTGGAKGTWGAGFSTGAHLHWGVKIGGEWKDPATLNPKTFGQPTQKDEKMLSFIATDPNGAWYVTDGLTKRAIAPGENQLLVDLGVARYSGKPGNVNLISPEQFDLIPTLEV
jgi:murein DD-endopeptidase MepM/ murein hydrolase activator NlpD